MLCVSCLSGIAARKVGTALASLQGTGYSHQGGSGPALLCSAQTQLGYRVPSFQDPDEERAGSKPEVLRAYRTIAEECIRQDSFVCRRLKPKSACE